MYKFWIIAQKVLAVLFRFFSIIWNAISATMHTLFSFMASLFVGMFSFVAGAVGSVAATIGAVLASLGVLIATIFLAINFFDQQQQNHDEYMLYETCMKKAFPKTSNDDSDDGGGDGSNVTRSNKALSYAALKKFAASGIKSTWGVSTSKAEHYFLSNNSKVAGKYGLNKSNISAVSAVVKKAGVSPVFFWLYSVNEGGGAGGFINHFGGDSGNAKTDAKKDAEYLYQFSHMGGQTPAVGGGEPASMPTGDAELLLKKLPYGSIGKVYIPATSAVTAEIESAAGHGSQVSHYFGPPLSQTANAIKSLGGSLSKAAKADNKKGGAGGSVSETGSADTSDTSTANSSNKADDCAKFIKNDDDSDGSIVKIAKSLEGYFTYAQVHGVSNIGSVEHPDKNGKTDCSGFVWLVLKKAGYKVPSDMQWYTKIMEDDAKGSHKWLKEVSKSDARPGDVVIVNTGSGSGSEGHTAILLSKWKGDKTEIIEEGGRTSRSHVNTDTFVYSFTSLLNNGGKPVIARPIK